MLFRSQTVWQYVVRISGWGYYASRFDFYGRILRDEWDGFPYIPERERAAVRRSVIAMLALFFGVLAIWSAYPDHSFSHRLRRSGFEVEEASIDTDGSEDNPDHTIWLATAVRSVSRLSDTDPTVLRMGVGQ